MDIQTAIIGGVQLIMQIVSWIISQKTANKIVRIGLYVFIVLLGIAGIVLTSRNAQKQKDDFAKLQNDTKNGFQGVMSAIHTEGLSAKKIDEPSFRIVTMDPTVEIGKKFSVNCKIENTGGNAPEVIIYSKIVLHTVPFNEFILDDSSKSIIRDFSSHEIRFISPWIEGELTKDFYDKMLAGRIYVYYYGRIIYTDKAKRQYKKDFCVVWDKDSKELIDVQKYRFIYEPKRANHGFKPNP